MTLKLTPLYPRALRRPTAGIGDAGLTGDRSDCCSRSQSTPATFVGLLLKAYFIHPFVHHIAAKITAGPPDSFGQYLLARHLQLTRPRSVGLERVEFPNGTVIPRNDPNRIAPRFNIELDVNVPLVDWEASKSNKTMILDISVAHYEDVFGGRWKKGGVLAIQPRFRGVHLVNSRELNYREANELSDKKKQSLGRNKRPQVSLYRPVACDVEP